MASLGRAEACPKGKEIKVVALSQRGIFRKDAPSNHDAGSGPQPVPKESMTMRFYTKQHRFYCGIDLHARLLAVCVLDQAGTVVLRTQIPDDPQQLGALLAPYRPDVVIAVECLFAWYWVADFCAAEGLPFVLGHALYMKAIHGAKSKDDDIDAEKISRLLRGGNLPMAYVYPKGLRETRDLLRRRNYLVRQRAALLTHIQIINAQYNLRPFGKKLAYAKNRAELKVAEHFPDAHVRTSVAADLALIDHLDEQIAELELYLQRTVKVEDPHTYYLLQTIPGVGKILALVLLYEIHDVHRFAGVGDFLSSARLVRCQHRSAGKRVGSGGKKIGNAHLKWAFSEAVCLLIRGCPAAKAWQARQEKKHGKKKTLSHPGGEAGAGGVPRTPQERRLRHASLPRAVAWTYGFLFSVPPIGTGDDTDAWHRLERLASPRAAGSGLGVARLRADHPLRRAAPRAVPGARLPHAAPARVRGASGAALLALLPLRRRR
jgi:transposase